MRQFQQTNHLLTPKQVADQLGVTTHTLAVWRSTKRYNLPYVKSGRLVRYRSEDVTAFIESRLQSCNTGSEVQYG